MSKSPYHLKVHAELFPEYPQGKMLNNKQRPKMSTILSAVDTSRSKSDNSKFKMNRRENRHPNELRLTRDTFYNYTHPLSFDNILFPLDNSLDKITNNSYPDKITVESFYKIPKTSRFFPPIEEQKSTNMQEILHVFGNNNASKKTIFRTSSDIGNDKSSESNDLHMRKMPEYEVDNDKADFLIEEVTPEVVPMYYNYTVPVNPFTCVVLQPYNADIDAQDKFSKFDIEVSIFKA